MDEKKLTQQVIEVIADTLSVKKEAIKEDTNLVEELGVDSLDMVDLVLAMEQEFGIEIKDEDITPDIKTVRDIVALLGKYLKF
ncbi:acyl carrier protein [bacterium 3DAC]|jgi:acyl carrier protein|nr:acyl carrier protein [Dictyoglomota bacterium]UZN22713.1 acyl carrier protein [bacterium 3DAC]